MSWQLNQVCTTANSDLDETGFTSIWRNLDPTPSSQSSFHASTIDLRRRVFFSSYWRVWSRTRPTVKSQIGVWALTCLRILE